MTTNCGGKLRRASVIAAMTAISLGASTGAFAQLNLDTVDPDSAPFNRPTEIVLDGTFNTGELSQIQVFFSETGTQNPATDAKGVVQAIEKNGQGANAVINSIVAVTPRVEGATESNVYVVNNNPGVDNKQSNTVDFEFTGSSTNNTQAAASALLEQLNDADTNDNGSLSFSEAEALIPGLTQVEFDAIDENGDGELSEAELRAAQRVGCAGGLGGLGGIFAFGIVAFLLSIWEQLRSRLFPNTHSWVPDVDQRDND